MLTHLAVNDFLYQHFSASSSIVSLSDSTSLRYQFTSSLIPPSSVCVGMRRGKERKGREGEGDVYKWE